MNFPSDFENEFIKKIASRYVEFARSVGCIVHERAESSIIMDVGLWHANVGSLRLDQLADARINDLTHDVSEIRQNIDRETGKAKEGCCFWPRCAL